MLWMGNKVILSFPVFTSLVVLNICMFVWSLKILRQRDDATKLLVKQGHEILQLRNQALHDYLTGLPNRALLEDRIQQALVNAQRDGSQFVIIFMDLDGFKPVNDTYGHNIGDHLLIDVGKRLRGAIRAGDTVARIGGDEFVILASISCSMDSSFLLKKIHEVLSEPFNVGNHYLHVAASIGKSVFPDDGNSLEGLLWKADEAMYLNKKIKKMHY
jgi:diguanylate cyclase (GGDEF)-like protein